MFSTVSKPERSPRFASLFSTRGGPFRFLLPPSCPPARTAHEGGLHAGLSPWYLEPAKRRNVHSRLNMSNARPKAVVGETSVEYGKRVRAVLYLIFIDLLHNVQQRP